LAVKQAGQQQNEPKGDKDRKGTDRTSERKMPGEIYLAMVEDFALDAWSML